MKVKLLSMMLITTTLSLSTTGCDWLFKKEKNDQQPSTQQTNTKPSTPINNNPQQGTQNPSVTPPSNNNPKPSTPANNNPQQGTQNPSVTPPPNNNPKPSTPANNNPKPPVSTEIYAKKPDIANCQAGVLTSEEKNKVLQKVNEIRQKHNLLPVVYDDSGDIETAKSALISVANIQLTHTPQKDAKCYSQEGFTGSKTSNLNIAWFHKTLKYDSTQDILSFLIDNKVESLGHRRWLLDPFLAKISFGRAEGKPLVETKWHYVVASSLKVIHSDKQDISKTNLDYVAYPYQDYPKDWHKKGWYHSFAVIVDKTNLQNNQNIDLTKATITVTDLTGNKLAVTAISSNTNFMGLPNNLQWKVADEKDNQQYQVKIDNVLVNGQTKSYQYWYHLN